MKFYDALFRRENEFLIEYMVEFSRGNIAVKIIGSGNPREMLKQYYIYLKRQYLT